MTSKRFLLQTLLLAQASAAEQQKGRNLPTLLAALYAAPRHVSSTQHQPPHFIDLGASARPSSVATLPKRIRTVCAKRQVPTHASLYNFLGIRTLHRQLPLAEPKRHAEYRFASAEWRMRGLARQFSSTSKRSCRSCSKTENGYGLCAMNSSRTHRFTRFFFVLIDAHDHCLPCDQGHSRAGTTKALTATACEKRQVNARNERLVESRRWPLQGAGNHERPRSHPLHKSLKGRVAGPTE